MNVEFKVNKAYIPHLQDQAGIQIFYGGSSSGKSVFIAQRVVLDLLQGGRNYLVIRKVARYLKRSVFNEICKVISENELDAYFSINHSDLYITAYNDYQILFCGLDDAQKLKSITPKKGVITDIWIEEATEAEFNDYKELTKRLRGVSEGDMNKRFTFTFNPILQSSWLYREFFTAWDDSKTEYRSADGQLSILKTTYKDNAFLTGEDRRKLEDETDHYYHEVYTLGNWGVLGSVIFKKWRMEDLSEKRQQFDTFRNGLDFGFAEDPAALIRTAYDRKHKTIYILDELYQRGMTNDILAAEVTKMVGHETVMCDSAEPKSITELRNHGVQALAVRKGKDSVLHGIQWLQQQEVVIDTSCQHTKNEWQQAKWKEDKDGNVLPQPSDKMNHTIDAVRYAYEEEMKSSWGW